MQKTAVTITVSTLVAGIFGAFLHWLQGMNAFEKETGFPIPGAMTTVVFLAYTALVVVTVAAVVLILTRHLTGAQDLAALHSGALISRAMGWVLGAAFVLCACVMMFGADLSRYPMFQRLFGVGGILAGLCIPALLHRGDAGGEQRAMGRAAAVVLPLFYCYWLVFCYKQNAEDPVVANYGFQILAIAAAAMSFYYVAAFFFGLGSPAKTLAALMLGVYLNIAVLFEEHSLPVTGLLAVTVVLLLMLEYLLLRNLKEKSPEEAEPPQAPDP